MWDAYHLQTSRRFRRVFSVYRDVLRAWASEEIRRKTHDREPSEDVPDPADNDRRDADQRLPDEPLVLSRQCVTGPPPTISSHLTSV